MFITLMHAKKHRCLFGGRGGGVLKGCRVEIPEARSLRGFEGDENDQQNDPAHQRDDV